MKVLGIRFCTVTDQADGMLDFFETGLGLPRRALPTGGAPEVPGGIFPAGESWIEVWGEMEGMPACTMLQIVVDDADAMATHARAKGLGVHGPVDAHGERIYYATAPNGLPVSFQSALVEEESD
jgi:hypothetical protein